MLHIREQHRHAGPDLTVFPIPDSQTYLIHAGSIVVFGFDAVHHNLILATLGGGFVEILSDPSLDPVSCFDVIGFALLVGLQA